MPAIAAATPWTAVAPLNPNFATESRDDEDVSIATDGNNNWVTHWTSNPTPGLEYDNYSARSTNNGVTWTGPVIVNSDNGIDIGQDITPQLATDRQGTWMAVWMKNVGPGTGADSDTFYARSFNNGTTWTAMAPLASHATTDTLYESFPHVATDRQGNWVAVWHAQDVNGPSTGMFLMSARSSNNGTTWSAAQLVTANALSTAPLETIPYVATDAKGNWVAVANAASLTTATTGFDKEIIAFRSTNNGATWSAPIVVNSNAALDTGSDEYPHISSDGRSTFLATWTTGSGFSAGEADIASSRSTDGGLSWSPMVAVNNDATTDTRAENEPYSVSDGHGSWLTAWRRVIGDSDIFYSESRDNGRTWTNTAALNSNAATDSGVDARVTMDSDLRGKWIATWHSNNVLAGGAGPDVEVLYSSTTFVNPELQVSPGALSFGTLHKDSGATGTLSVVLTNTGLANLLFTGAGLAISGTNAGDFSLVSPVTTPIAAGTSRTVQVSFDPTAGGARVANLVITTNDGAQPTAVVTLSGVGTDPTATTLQSSVNFGQQLVTGGATSPQTVTIQNTGTFGDLVFTGAQLAITGTNAADFSIVTSNTAPIAPGGTRPVQITFDPSAPGNRSANLVITTNDAATSTVVVALSGVGTNPTASVVPGSLNFGLRHISTGPSAPQNVTISNVGTFGDLVFTAGISGSNAADFIMGSLSTTPLAPGTSRTVQVTFDPSAVGARAANFVVTSNDGAQPTVTVPLSGTGTDQTATIVEDIVYFGQHMLADGASAAKTVTVRNDGTVGNLNFSGLTITGANASEFLVSGTPSLAPLAPGATRTFDVVFDPAANGLREAYLNVATDDPGSPDSVRLVGVGISGPTAAQNWQLLE